MTEIATWRLTQGLVLALTLSCGSGVATGDRVTVFAAASLTDAFTQIAGVTTELHPELRIEFSFAGSQQLASQIEHGAPADLYATANRAWMTYLSERTLVTDDETFATNDLSVLASSSISFRDLARPGMQIVVGAETVPVGSYTRIFLEGLAQTSEYGPAFVDSLRANIVSQEDNVRVVVSKVLVGEADAAFIYRTELQRLRRGGVYAVPVPPRYNVSTEYLIATVAGSQNVSGANMFRAVLFSDAGRAVLEEHGFRVVTPE